MKYDVPLIAQSSKNSCWAAALAMIVSWASGKDVAAIEVARQSSRLLEYNEGLDPLDGALFEHWNMVTEAPQTYTADGFFDLLNQYGPIWVAAMAKSAHVRVATGFEFDQDPYQGLVYINDPLEPGMSDFSLSNKGSTYTLTYIEFAQQYEALGTADMKINSETAYPVYFAHLSKNPLPPP